MRDDHDAPSRRRRLLALWKIALALIAPVFAPVAMYFLTQSISDADGGVSAAPVTASPLADPTSIPQVHFTKHLAQLSAR